MPRFGLFTTMALLIQVYTYIVKVFQGTQTETSKSTQN